MVVDLDPRRARGQRGDVDPLAAVDHLLVAVLVVEVGVTLEGGLGFGASLHAAAKRMPAPIGDEIRLMMQEHSMGITLSEALGIPVWIPSTGAASSSRIAAAAAPYGSGRAHKRRPQAAKRALR